MGMQKRILVQPNILILHLKRFVPNFEKRRYDKRHQFVDIPTTLDWQSLTSESTRAESTTSRRLPAHPLAREVSSTDVVADACIQPTVSANSEQSYLLRAVIAHSGASPQAGHYVCYTRCESGTWWLYNDSEVRELGRGQYQRELGRKAYIIVYVLGNHQKFHPLKMAAFGMTS